ncbi:MAG TPA: dihydrodipicolinate synthase family protein [Pyrinomonadaceae bacterium]|nr:dihydrodipicolinate synthase family protein [Pyrinomonadaceae bacterium]
MKRQHQTNESHTTAHPLAQGLRGVLLPFPTPIAADYGIEQDALRSNLSRWNRTGIAGYVALGSTGERVHLDERESLEVIETARACVPESLAFVVGAGQQSTRASVDEVRRVAEAGADAVLVITPHFYRAEMTQSVLVKHYLEVADASPVPVLLYSVPQLTNVTIAPETVARLSEHENIVGVKDSSGDVPALAEMVRLVPEGFAVLTGNGSALYPALCVGARGGILAIGCVAPRLAVEVYEAFGAGEHERARAAQVRLARVTRGVLGRYGISGLKAALDMLGYAGGQVRAPLQDASDEARREIEEVLRETGLLGQDSFSAGASRE